MPTFPSNPSQIPFDFNSMQGMSMQQRPMQQMGMMNQGFPQNMRYVLPGMGGPPQQQQPIVKQEV
jgi:hypothetical protein